MAPDGPEQIQHVSDTALMVAACRAIETARADGLVRDPFAERLAGPRGEAILHSISGWQVMCFGIGVRTRTFTFFQKTTYFSRASEDGSTLRANPSTTVLEWKSLRPSQE